MGEAAQRKSGPRPIRPGFRDKTVRAKDEAVAPSVKLRLRKINLLCTFDVLRKEDLRGAGEMVLPPAADDGTPRTLQVFEGEIPDEVVKFLKDKLPDFKANAL